MAKVNGGAAGCRAIVMAGQFLSKPAPPLAQPQQNTGQRKLAKIQRCMLSVTSAVQVNKTPVQSQLDAANFIPLSERSVWSNRTLVYRDVKAFLSEVGGDPREARYWLTQFQRANVCKAPAFAVLEVSMLTLITASSISWSQTNIKLSFCFCTNLHFVAWSDQQPAAKTQTELVKLLSYFPP